MYMGSCMVVVPLAIMYGLIIGYIYCIYDCFHIRKAIYSGHNVDAGLTAFSMKSKRLAVLLLVSVLLYIPIKYSEMKYNFCAFPEIAISSYLIYAIWEYSRVDFDNMGSLSRNRLSLCIQGMSLAFIKMTITLYAMYLVTYGYLQYIIRPLLTIELPPI